MAEPDCRAFLAEILPLLETQESRILLPKGFSPIHSGLGAHLDDEGFGRTRLAEGLPAG